MQTSSELPRQAQPPTRSVDVPLICCCANRIRYERHWQIKSLHHHLRILQGNRAIRDSCFGNWCPPHTCKHHVKMKNTNRASMCFARAPMNYTSTTLSCSMVVLVSHGLFVVRHCVFFVGHRFVVIFVISVQWFSIGAHSFQQLYLSLIQVIHQSMNWSSGVGWCECPSSSFNTDRKIQTMLQSIWLFGL